MYTCLGITYPNRGLISEKKNRFYTSQQQLIVYSSSCRGETLWNDLPHGSMLFGAGILQVLFGLLYGGDLMGATSLLSLKYTSIQQVS